MNARMPEDGLDVLNLTIEEIMQDEEVAPMHGSVDEIVTMLRPILEEIINRRFDKTFGKLD